MTKSIKDLSTDELDYIQRILYLQGDVEYGFYNLYLEWQSKDNTSSEQRWRTARMVTDEVGHGLQIVRLFKQIGNTDLQKKLENKPFGSHEIGVSNRKLETWDDVVMVATVLSQIDSINLRVMENCNITEISELARNFLLQETLHLDFGVNSVEEILKGDSLLGSREGLEKSFRKYYSAFEELFAYGSLNPGSMESLNYKFGNVEEEKSAFTQLMRQSLERFELDLGI